MKTYNESDISNLFGESTEVIEEALMKKKTKATLKSLVVAAIGAGVNVGTMGAFGQDGIVTATVVKQALLALGLKVVDNEMLDTLADELQGSDSVDYDPDDDKYNLWEPKGKKNWKQELKDNADEE